MNAFGAVLSASPPDGLGGVALSVFAAGTFAAALVTALAGFAFGLVAAAVWLHVLTPIQSAALIVAFGLMVQGYSVWKVRHALRLGRLLPFVIGAVIGVPLGVLLLHAMSAGDLRAGIGILLTGFSLYSLMQPKLRPIRSAGRLADGSVGILSGAVGGATGLAGILAVAWCTLRGWSKDEQRAVFQPVSVFIFALTALSLGATGFVGVDVVLLFLLGLPFLIVGTWLGLKLYGQFNEATFRQVLLWLLLASGLSLIP